MVGPGNISMPMQSYLQGALGTMVGEVLSDVMISDYDIQAFKEGGKKDIMKTALVRAVGKLTSSLTYGMVHGGDIQNYRETGSLKETLMKKDLVGMALTAATIAMPQLAIATAVARRVGPEITAEDIAKKAGDAKAGIQSRVMDLEMDLMEEDPEIADAYDPNLDPDFQKSREAGGYVPPGNERTVGRQLRAMQKGSGDDDNQPDSGEDSGEGKEGASPDGNEQSKMRALKGEKSKAQAKKKKQAQAKAKKQLEAKIRKKITDMALKAGFRTAAAGSAATLIGLVVTYILWAIQIIAGNWLKSQIIPPLGLGERIAFGVVTFIMVLAVIIAFIFVMLTFVLMNGWVIALSYFGSEMVLFFKDFLGM